MVVWWQVGGGGGVERTPWRTWLGRSGRVHATVASGHGLAGVVASLRDGGCQGGRPLVVVVGEA